MPRIFDFAGRDVERRQTVAGLRALKGAGRRAVQTTAESAEEAAAADEAGVEMVVCRAANVRPVRAGSPRLFVTAALGFTQAVTADEMLRAAFAAIEAGADAIITARSPDMVRALAAEQIPVVAHLGFVPRKSTWIGAVRAVGKTAAEALALWDRFRRMEDAGAFAAECELIPAAVMLEINQHTSLVTISLGSGADADVMFLFAADVCGETARRPRHARAWGDLASLLSAVRHERVKALSGFRAAVASGDFPGPEELAAIPAGELADFRARLGIEHRHDD
jgi:3-methyl-2-oxobutanoate hydroxymethyltransferase